MKILILNQTNIDMAEDVFKSFSFFEPFVEVEYTVRSVRNVPTEIEHKLTRQGFDKNTGKPAMVKYMGLKNLTKEYLRKNFPDASNYDQVVFTHDMDKLTIPSDSVVTSWTTGEPLFKNTEYIELCVNQYFKDNDKIWKALTHENIHGYCYRANRDGIPVLDEMDNMLVSGVVMFGYKNDDPYAPDGNYAHTLGNLKPFFDKQKSGGVLQNFDKAVSVILKHEGGYVNDPKDPGGETKYGISKRSYPNLNIKNLTQQQARDIYYRDHWLKCKCDQMQYGIALNVFDMAVNSGTINSIKILQKIVGTTVDGIIGPKTLAAIAAYVGNLTIDFSFERMKYYQSLAVFNTYKNGWTKRVFETLKESLK